jgi:hypothetical protein
LEYLLMIAGGVLLSAVMVAVVNSNLGLAAGQFNAGEYSSRIQNYLSSGPAGNDGDWVIVGNDQYSGVPGNVGIGTTSPQAKLEVTGKILMDSATEASDSAITVATKGYVDSGLSAKQARVTGNCTVGSFISAVAADGSVSCGAVPTPVASWNTSGNNQYSAVSGNVGIGTSAPGQKLEVNGSVLATGDVCNGGGKCLNSIYQTSVIVGSNPTCPAGQSIIMKGYNGIWYTYDSAAASSTWTKVVCGVFLSADGTALLVNNVHTGKNCRDLDGTVVSDGTNSFCRFDRSTCDGIGLGDWRMFNSWSTTGPAELSCTARDATCGYGCSATCTAPVHAWSSNGAIEGCTGSCYACGWCGMGNSCGNPSCDAYSHRVQVGCY